MVKRIIVGAHYGLTGWLAQRITAAVMALATLVMLCGIWSAPPLTYAIWKGLFAKWWMWLSLSLFSLAVMLHAWVGVRDILMDYVKPAGIRLALEVLVLLALAYYTVWAMQILWRI
jgi:succinate dehydrogenase / fumarate reductase, membrane anchor subunit